MAEMRDTSDTIYHGCIQFVENFPKEIDELFAVWIKAQDFVGFGTVLVNLASRNCLTAGAIALRKYDDPEAALNYWKAAELSLRALTKGIEIRKAMKISDFSLPGTVDFRARDFLYLQYCLLFLGDRSGLSIIRDFHDLPFVKLIEHGEREADPISAEARMQFAAWEGDLPLVERLTKSLKIHYKRFRLSEAYSELWQAVATRDSVLLEKILPEAEVAYKSSGKRKANDIWGGEKYYNNSMFDIYTASILKIACDVGMKWSFSNKNTETIWPKNVIERWIEPDFEKVKGIG